jgi:tetrahydromethanopterin S-methyltransferase subunit A
MSHISEIKNRVREALESLDGIERASAYVVAWTEQEANDEQSVSAVQVSVGAAGSMTTVGDMVSDLECLLVGVGLRLQADLQLPIPYVTALLREAVDRAEDHLMRHEETEDDSEYMLPPIRQSGDYEDH